MFQQNTYRGLPFLLAIVAASLTAVAPARALPQLCVIRGNACIKGCANGVEQFGQWLGRPMSRVTSFANGGSWQRIIYEATRKARWLHRDGPGYPLNLGVTLLPGDDSSATLAAGAAGAYDQYFRQIAEALVAEGQSNADLRLGWEFNGNWYRWKASADPQAFVAYWRRIVDVMRSVPGEHFTFDWNPSLLGGAVNLESVYPGDAYVDYIGVDIFNDGSTSLAARQRWTNYLDKPQGLNWLSGFASRHGKPLTVPAWGTGEMSRGNGSLDDAYFVTHLTQWLEKHDVVFACYFDSLGATISNGSQPRAAQALIDAWGRRRDKGP